MSLFARTWEIERDFIDGWVDNEERGDVDNGVPTEERSFGVEGLEDHSRHGGSTRSHTQEADASVGFFEGIFGSSGGAKPGAEGDGDISQYWQNYDLSVSEAPKLFSDAEFEAVKRIQDGLKVLVLRKRLQERITARNREREVRAAVRVQAIVRGIVTRAFLPALREQHTIRARTKRQYKMFKRELRSEGFAVHLYRTKDGALRKVVLKPDGKLTSLCWSMGVAKVKSGSIPLIALKSCYSGYPKHDFPTKSMQARATPLPDRSKTFTIQGDAGRVFVFVAADDVLHKKLVKGLQCVIAEISSPDSFYFDGTGVLRRVTSSIFDDRGNVAQREAAKRERHALFRFRQEENRGATGSSPMKAAVKYGRKERGYPDPKTGEPRWMYTLGNLVYITDDSSTREITSYCQPLHLPMAPLTSADLSDYERAKDNLRRNPHLCTSHTVIVVDHSRSMATPDVMDHVNRIKASFERLAVDFVAEQMASRSATNTDVVSVMLMHDGVDVLFEREPMGRFLYNRLVDIRDKVRPRSHGNFLPSLDHAEQLLLDDSDKPNTALLLFFLSDGKPSDGATGIMRGGNKAVAKAISDRVSLLAGTFRHRLNVVTLGFASDEQDFSVLESMAEAARAAGAKGSFQRPELSSAGLASALSSAISSLTETKTTLASTLAAPAGRVGAGAGGGVGVGPRSLPPIQEFQKESADSEHQDGWVVYADEVERMEYRPESVDGVEEHPWQVQRFFSPEADAIAIRKNPFGEGAERLVYKMQEYDTRWGVNVGDLFVGKQSNRMNEDLSSINTSAKALTDAAKLAKSFNLGVQERLSACGPNGRVDPRVWGVHFLSCSTYAFADRGFTRVILAEKWLDPLAFRKWNSNNGYVFHGRGYASVQPSSAETVAQRAAAEAHADRLMDEGAEEDAIDYGTGAEEYIREGGGGGGGEGGGGSGSGLGLGLGLGSGARKRSHQQMALEFLPKPTDYLQAFSHFSYHHSERTMLVCDLQGVMSNNAPADPSLAGVFELTDPVIHFQSKSGERQVYGRTDLGRKGMRKFFRTHDCNDVCRLLDLPGSRSPEIEAFAKITRTAAAERARAKRRGV